MANTTRSRKNKGVRLQNTVASMIRRIFRFRKEDVKPAIMGETGVDIHLSSLAKQRCPLAIECKNVEKLNIWDALKQTEKNATGKEKGVLFFKRNHSKIYVAMDAEYFLEVLNFVTDAKQIR